MILAAELEAAAQPPPDDSSRAHPEVSAPPRWLLITRRLYEGGTVTLRYLMSEFGISLATAKRDMVTIEANLPVVRDPRDHPAQPVTIRLSPSARRRRP